jgi:hypothetical protein
MSLQPIVARLLLFCSLVSAIAVAETAPTLNAHPVRLDDSHKLMSWLQPQSHAYEEVISRAWKFLETMAPDAGGLPAYYTNCCVVLPDYKTIKWPHNPAFVNASITDSALRWYAYSGDSAPLELAQKLLSYQLGHGTTFKGWVWSHVPYASSTNDDLEYLGAQEFRYYPVDHNLGHGDGVGVIESDKVGELGLAYLQMYEATGKTEFRDAGIDCANALAQNVREGDFYHSPWPFRVYAQNGDIREEYTANVIAPIRLFDEAIKAGVGDIPSYQRARKTAWDWMMKFPMVDDAWAGVFEDVHIHAFPYNMNQFSAAETARYLLLHPETDPQWREHASHLLDYIQRHFAIDAPGEPGLQFGAQAISEQVVDMNKMGSHTARYASVQALYFERTGDTDAREKAFRSFNWATYMCRDNGAVVVGPVDQSIWFSDGYGDYIRHLLAGMASVPEWSPQDESHLLRSTSVVRSIRYEPSALKYRTAGSSDDLLHLTFAPKAISLDGVPLLQSKEGDGWNYNSATGILKVAHRAGEIEITSK